VGKKTGNNPTDRAKKGTSRSVITDGSGVPLGLITAGANVHDTKLFEETLNAVIVDKPDGIHNLLGDKGYDSDLNRHISWAYGYEPHIRSRGEEIKRKKKDPRKRNRRWVVERTFSWFNKFRRLYIRWEKKSKNYDAFLHIACAVIAFRASGILG
jgi:transposase